MVTELEAAKAVATGELPSPYQLDKSLWLIALRITGSGSAYRIGLNEHTWRDPAFYMNQEFCDRCAGLPVVIDHPDSMQLDAEEYAKRAIGSIMHAYLKPAEGEVWGVARVNDGAVVNALSDGKLSTSPAFVLAKGQTAGLPDGKHWLIEGQPLLLDHCAVVGEGVWDKAGAAGRGIKRGDGQMADEPETEGERGEHHDQIEKLLNAFAERMDKRMDGFERRINDLSRQRKADDKRRDDGGDQGVSMKDDNAEEPNLDDPRPGEPKQLASDDNDEESEEKRADAQAELTEAFQAALGVFPPLFTSGQSIRNYQLRALNQLKKFSPDYKPIDLNKLAPDALALAWRTIRADAVRAGKDPHLMQQFNPSLDLREIIKVDRTGRRISEFAGPVSALLDTFRLPSYRVRRINTNPERHY